MERIKQALERARLERLQTGAPEPSFSSGNPVDAGAVVYTQTRTAKVSKSYLQEKRVIAGIAQNAYTEAYKILRTQILQRLREKNWNSLAVTSAGVNEGKTLTAINLAISLAMEVNYSVLLVDADLRHPSVHTYFGFNAERGLSDYLTADMPLSELLIHPADIPRFVLLPGGKPLSNSSEMLNSPKLVRLVEEMKARYPSRIILFDLPPLLSAADALAFSPYVDAALLVIEEGKTQAQDVQHAVGLLQGTTLIGTVLNKSLTNPPHKVGDLTKWFTRFFGQLRSYALLLQAWLGRLRLRKF
jgi:exopolysaccharide/PEP-CTERM locus tyrosine autokinase